jgi:26S proteasome regulatory subunit N7
MAAAAAASADAAVDKKSSKKSGDNSEVDPHAPPPLDDLLVLLRHRFTFTSDHSTPEAKAAAISAIEAAVEKNGMEPYAQLIAEAVPLNIAPAKLNAMRAANAEKLAKIEAEIKEAERSAGESEVREAMLEKANHFAKIGDITAAVAAIDAAFPKTLATGQKLDLCFHKVRLGLAVGDNNICQQGIDEAKKKSKDGDWERRNRLRIYEGLHFVMTRNFPEAAKLLLDGLSTFAATELLSMDDFVFITCLVSLVALPRNELKTSIIDCPDVLAADVADTRALATNVHQCKYDRVLSSVYTVCVQMRRNVFLAPHVDYFFREVRVRAFNQFLDSYRSVTLQSMSSSFKVSPQVLDQMLFTFISSGRLQCKIDRVSGNVVTTRGDRINSEYSTILRNGDLLLHKMQKLSRVIEFE